MRARSPARCSPPAAARRRAKRRSRKSCRSPRRSSRRGVEANSDKLFVVVTFSGGGKRAAAFSYGVLEALRDVKVTTPDGEQHSLLDEIDLISAVSGGAFTAAYYALQRPGDLRQLRAPLPQSRHGEGPVAQGARARRTGRGSPIRLVSRSDLEVEYFDEELFNGATVYDVMTRSPRVIITATDLVRAKPFAFTREQLNGICVDPKSVPVARAVFASAATPIYFAPLVMRNFAGSCGYQPPDIVSLGRGRRRRRLPARARRAAAVVPRLARTTRTCTWPMAHWPTTSARAPSSTRWRSATSVTDALRRNGFSRARRMLFIVVDARTGFDRRYAQMARAARHQEGHGRGGQRHVQPLQLRDHEPDARAREALGERGAHHALQGRRSPFRTATSSTSTSSSCRFERVKDADGARLPRPRSRPRSRCRPSRSSACAAPHTCWWRSRPNCARSSRNPPGARRTAASRRIADTRHK